MKRFLSIKKGLASLSGQSGFTLVELLIVIAIIGILVAIGFSVFGGTGAKARDAKRRADINAIATSMEVNFGKTSVEQYDSLAATMFTSGVIPTDPIDTGDNIYCVRQGESAQTGGACTSSVTKVAAGAPAGGSSNPFWVVCANLETVTGGFYCKGNANAQ